MRDRQGWWECSRQVMNEFHCALTPLSLYHLSAVFFLELHNRHSGSRAMEIYVIHLQKKRHSQ